LALCDKLNMVRRVKPFNTERRGMKIIEPNMEQSPAGRQKPAGSFNSIKDASAVVAVIVIDLFAVTISLLLAYLIRNYLLINLFPGLITDKLLAHTFNIFWWYPFIFIVALAYEKLYHKRLPFWIEVQWIFKAGTMTLFLTVILLYLVGIGEEISRSLVILTWIFAMMAIPLFRFYGKSMLLRLSIWSKPVIIIGNSETIPIINGALLREATMGYKVIGCINSGAVPGEGHRPGSGDLFEERSGLACLGTLSEAEAVVKATEVDDLFITDSGLSSTKLVELTNRLQPLVNNIILVPDLFGVSLSGIEAAYFFEEQAVMLQIKNRLRSVINRTIKRIFDLTIGAVINIFTLPLMLGLSLAIKLDSKGPVLYVSERIGREGKIFLCYKFRTMYVDADDILKHFLAENEQACSEWRHYRKLITEDPRITRVGRILRRLSIDELPQVLNVLRGEMSLVGPRPYLPEEREEMGSYSFDILVGKPGLTGLWQVSGRNKLSFDSRLKLDAWYMKNWSLWLDIVLLFKTVRVVLKRDGAY